MESGHIIRDFMLNLKRIEGSNEDEREKGAQWMNELTFSEHLWKVKLSQILNDILSINPKPSKSWSSAVDDCFPVKTATILMGKLFSNRIVVTDRGGKITDIRSKILHDSESIDKIIVNSN
ncbi:hypothetical protein RF11_12161 [Thelohanellus kitauei]|uniref:Uncharacterized protein n=1 Tax=Thelohanellus kitauei TaxID=669202 RepID=A0A0C2MMT5_THEKT|nr:hypothetical protein RF11_12161 [Thelohanellus kitauei]